MLVAGGHGLAFELPLVLYCSPGEGGNLDAKKLSQLRMYWVVAGLTLLVSSRPTGTR